jgi:hypothetical protein
MSTTSSPVNVLLRSVLRGNSVLFLGAGFAGGTIVNTLGHQVPGSIGLAKALLQSIGEVPNEDDLKKPLTDIADYCFSKEEWRAAAVQKLRLELSVANMAEWQKTLLVVPPWKRIYTTNYDTAIELAFGQATKKASHFSATAKYVRPINDSITCVHINGMIGRTDAANVDRELRLSSASYAGGRFDDSEWSNLLASDLAYSDCVVFVGFSMSDLDIGRLVVSEQVKDRVLFFNGSHVDRFSAAKLTNYGLITGGSGEDLATQLGQELRSNTPRVTQALTHFRRLEIPHAPSVANDLDRYSLLLYGDVKEALLLSPTSSGKLGYAFPRGHEDAIVQDLKLGKDIAVLSSLGNGKSVFLSLLALRMNREGWRVVEPTNGSMGTLAEVEAVCSYPGLQVVLLDEVTNHLKVLERFGLYRSSLTRLVLSDRTIRYDRVLDPDRFHTYRIDAALLGEYLFDDLNDTEVSCLIRLLDAAGLWGQTRLDNHQKKEHFISKKCRGELSITLLAAAKSPELRKRLETAFSLDSLSAEIQRALICVSCLKVFGFSATTHTISRLIGTRAVESLLRNKSEIISKLLDMTSGRVTVHSAIFASLFLKELVPAETVLSTLAQMVASAHRHDIRFQIDDPTEYGEKKSKTASELYVFRSVQQIVKAEENFDAIYGFYEAIRESSSLKDEALYWLQYAIAKLFSKDLEATKRYLDTAYGAAARSNLTPFQIDNQYARYLLETTATTGNTTHAYDAFCEAHRILLDQALRATHMHYPYRIALRYHDFVSMHRHALNPMQREFTANAIAAVVDRAKVAKVPLEKQFWVDKCQRRLAQTAKLLV